MAPSTSAERGREVRRKLLRAARELIPELGWSAVSTRVLAERAEVRAGLVHYHFASLQALLREAAVGAMREVLHSADSALDPARTPEAALELVLGGLDAHSGTDPTSLLFTETYLASTRDEQLRAELAELLAQFRDRFAHLLAEHGHERPGETAQVLAAAIDGVMLHRALNPALTSAVVTPVLSRLVRAN